MRSFPKDSILTAMGHSAYHRHESGFLCPTTCIDNAGASFMASLVLGSEFSRRTHHRRAAGLRMRRRLRFGFELLEARITPAPMTPTVTGVSPSSGPAGTSVEVQGTNFSGAEAIYFRSEEHTSELQSPA